MNLTTDYLIVIDKLTHKAFYDLCDNQEELKRLLEKQDSFQIKDGKLVYLDNIAMDLSISLGEIEGKEQKYFRTKLTCETNDDEIEEFAKATRAFRQTIVEAGAQVQTLYSDISAYYSKQCYPLLHYVENLMRKLLKFFMVIQIGKDWLEEASPKDIKEALSKTKRSEYGDALFDLDFIHLGDFLFKLYSRRSENELIDIIDAAENSDDLDLEELKKFKARSNWERYFSAKVDCSDDYLKSRWEELYKLRNKVAHNIVIGKAEYERIKQLVSEVGEKLETAFDKIVEINVPPQEKEQLAEELASNVNELSGEFIRRWRRFENKLRTFAGEEAFDSTSEVRDRLKSYRTPFSILTSLFENGVVTEETYNLGRDVSKFRNELVHSGVIAFDETLLLSYLSSLKTLDEAFVLDSEKIDTGAKESKAINVIEGELVDNRTKLYKLPSGEIVKVQFSRFHPQHQTYWYGIAPNSYAAAKRRGCTAVIFVMGDKGFIKVDVDVLDRFLDTAYVTNFPDGSLRHYHVYITPPPRVRLKAPTEANDIVMTDNFTSFG